MCRHQMRGPEPRRQRKPCAVHRCARRDRSLAAATVAFVSVCPAPQRGRAGVAASGTNESIRPATFEQEGRAARLVGKRRLKFGERSRPRHRVLPWSPIAGLNKGWIPHLGGPGTTQYATVGAPEVEGFKSVAKRNGIVSFNMTYAKDALSPDFPLVFHQLQAPPTWGPILIKRALDLFHFKTVVLVGPNDQGGTDGTKALAQLYKQQGVSTTEEYYQRGTTNFAAVATRIMNENPDLVELGTTPPGDQSLLVKQLLEAGYQGTFGSLGGGGEKVLLEGASGDPKNLGNAFWLNIVALEHPSVPQMKADFELVMKAPLPTFPHFYVAQTSAEQVLKAMSVAGTDKDGEKIADALRNMTPESRYFGKGGWRGKTQYGINQELAFPVGLGIYQDGKRIGVETVPIPAE